MAAITDEIREFLSRTHAYAWTISHSPDEPAIVHAFLCDEMWPVFQNLVQARVKSQTDVLIRGIFTHQTPLVREVGEAVGCEIADLMLIRLHIPKDIRAKPLGKAVLLQAKHKEAPETEPLDEDGDTIQLKLYRDWNKFVGTRRLSRKPADDTKSDSWNFRGTSGAPRWRRTAEYLSVLNGRAFNLDDPNNPQFCSVSPGADNSLIKEHRWPNGTCWANGQIYSNSTPAEGVKCPNDFAETLTEFISNNFGREFDTELSGSADHWSIFVAEMLRVANLPGYKFGKKRLTRSNAVSVLASCLPLISDHQLTRFVDGTLSSGFEFINACLERETLASERGSKDKVPGHDDAAFNALPGHIPMLVMITYGEELVVE